MYMRAEVAKDRDYEFIFISHCVYFAILEDILALFRKWCMGFVCVMSGNANKE